MLAAILALPIALVLLLAAMLMRRPAAPVPADPRQLQLPEQLIRLEARQDALDQHLRAGLAELRDTHAGTATHLRTEVTGSLATLDAGLTSELATFRQQFGVTARELQSSLCQQHESLLHKLTQALGEARSEQNTARETLHTRLNELSQANTAHQERLRITVSDSLERLNAGNAAKLEEMRVTVDEKLNATLHSRLTESFGQVTDQLNKVHTGLGEMSKLSEGVDDLSRLFSNVKSRGGFAEVQLGMLLEQMLAPGQFVRNARVKPGSAEVVEFAVRFPGHSGETLLPIDAKFPREAWERLETAYSANDPEALATAGKAFEAAIRVEGKRISEKYINPPNTTPHAIMFLPTEGLYAEVMRRDALQAEIQSKCQVTIAGPSTLSAILTSFQMGFQMLALQEKGDQVWKVLESAKTQFGKFGGLLDKVEKQVGTVQNTLRDLNAKTSTINRSLRAVSDSTEHAEAAFDFGDVPGGTLRLVAAEAGSTN